MIMSISQDDYLCVGMCMADPDSGYCLGCGRPPAQILVNSQTLGEGMLEDVFSPLAAAASRYPDSPENH